MKNLFKKFLVICGIIGAISATSGFIGAQSASAIDPIQSRCEDFLGLTSWDCNVNISDEESLKSGIWIIAANVATDITVIAAYLIIGYVIYGGYLYVFSGGDPSKLATGKKALSQAFIGLAIVVSANVILNSIRIALGNVNFTENCATGKCIDAGTMIDQAISWVIRIAGIVSAIFVVYGGISYATSAGEPSKLQKAKSMITYALIGLAIVALARVITAFVFSMIREANKTETTSLIIDTTKEHYENQKIS